MASDPVDRLINEIAQGLNASLACLDKTKGHRDGVAAPESHTVFAHVTFDHLNRLPVRVWSVHLRYPPELAPTDIVAIESGRKRA